MRRRIAVLAAAAGVAVPGSAHAATLGDGVLHALAGHQGRAYAVVDSTDRRAAFDVVATTGGAGARARSFGRLGDEFPDIASVAGEPVVAWSSRISGGAALSVAPLSEVAEPKAFGWATGPGRLVAPGGVPAVAAPDLLGDAGLFTAGGTFTPLTDTGPQERHAPLDAADDGARAVVLDLVQMADPNGMPDGEDDPRRPGRSALRVLGEDAPRTPVVSVGRVTHIPGAIAVGDGRIAVAYVDLRGRIMLATAAWSPDARWSVRSLGRPVGLRDAPALAVSGGRAFVVTVQAGAGGADAYVTTVATGGKPRTRRLTRTPLAEQEPHVAATDGRVFAGWTAHEPSRNRDRAVVVRVP